jgi:biotin carboxylase
LILNGSHSEIPLIKAAKKLGHYVITTGNAPQLIGHSFADEYHYADFSNLKDILNLSKKLKIDAICSCANDFGTITSSYVSERLSLPGHDTYKSTLILNHKDSFKDFALKNRIPTPNARAFTKYTEAISALSDFSYPLIIKPVDLTGGKGVTKVISEDGYEKAVKIAFQMSPKKRIVVEEFIDGSQHSFSTFIHKGKVIFYFSDNEYSYLNPYLVSTSAAPSTNVNNVSEILIKASEKIVKLLSLGDGIFHIQYLYKNGKAMIIEITRRCSGDLYPYPVNKSTGIDWAEWIVKAETGMDCSDFPEIKQTGFCGRHCIMSSKNGVVKDVLIDNCIKNNIYDSLIWWKKNDLIENHLIHKLGVVLLEYQSMDEMIKKTAQLNEMIKVIIE